MSHKKSLILAPFFFCHFTAKTTSRFFMKELCALIASEDVHMNILFGIF
jgi:hypothetical protein